MQTGQGIQVCRNKTSQENVVAKVEDEANRVSYSDRVHPHHRALYMWGVRLWKVKISLAFFILPFALLMINKHILKAAVCSIEY